MIHKDNSIKKCFPPKRRAQTAMEYMLLLGLVVTIILASFKSLLPRITRASNEYFNKVSIGLMGEAVNEVWLDSCGAGGGGSGGGC